jgi:hypothetical protein
VVGQRQGALSGAEMKSRRLRKTGTVLFAMTVLTFVALPFWIFALFDRMNDWIVVDRSMPAAAQHFFTPVLFLPLLIIAIIWIGFLLTWLVSSRAKPASLPESETQRAKTGSWLLLTSGALALAVTVPVELGYLDWIGGAAFGSTLDESDSSLSHFYRFIEVPQFFLALLWTPFLLVAWLPRPNSPAAKWRLCLPIGFLLLAVTGLVWVGYPDWTVGVGIVSAAHKQIPADAFRVLEAVPALFVACVWLWLLWFLGSSLRRA